ncbi:NDR1/HIN1-like protein 10 [Arachis ipaensis]|uniref:NDR1/HIN1-like protein 10 n=1 Tax=Arachis ipaensis TaxID=130454 RepID=UPI0007AFD720|nr:NDR1/HIN1-like protein 10 [Arachis ipaensis]
MAENKQSQLNGSYYGPSIPPNNNRRRRNCCCRIFNIFWKILLSIITLIVLLFIISLIIVQPRPFKFSVTQASLTQFNYTSTLLHYKLVLNFTSHNPNKKLGFYYDKVEGNVFYQGSRFSTIDVITWLNSFRQDSKHTDRMSGVFKGTKVLVLDQSQRSKFDQDKRDGDFDIYVKLHFDIRFGLGGFIFNNIKFINSKATVKCGIKVPLSGSNGKVVGARFEPKKCKVNVKWV